MVHQGMSSLIGSREFLHDMEPNAVFFDIDDSTG